MKILIKYTDQEGHKEEIKWNIEAQKLCGPRGLARPRPRMCTPSQQLPLPPSPGTFFLPSVGLSAAPPDSVGIFREDRRPLTFFFSEVVSGTMMAHEWKAVEGYVLAETEGSAALGYQALRKPPWRGSCLAAGCEREA